MRAALLLVYALATLAAVAACASSDDDETAPPPAPDSGDVTIADASTNEAAPDVEAEVGLPPCSSAGWCTTSLPDVDLMMKDIWPLSGRAFAVAESATLGVKVLEWTDVDGAWKYIDDNTQNEVGGKYAGTIWSPNDDEVYYGVAPGYIYHGKRLAPPATEWSWSRHQLEDNSHRGEPGHETHDHGHPRNAALLANYPALGVWGTGADDVYAWYSNSVYHWTSDDGGAPAWVAEYIANDHDASFEHLLFVSAAGTGRDDVWFSGGRSGSNGGSAQQNCALAVRKTSEGYRRIADGVIQGGSCVERAGVLYIGGTKGWLTDIQSLGTDKLVGLNGAREVARISVANDNVSVSLSPVQMLVPFGNGAYRSLWGSSEDVWLTAWGLVIRGEGAGDAGVYEVSTISLNGAPLNTPMHRVRGTSNTNLWAIGNGYALHKTTP